VINIRTTKKKRRNRKEHEEGNEYSTKKLNFSKAFAKDVFINQKQKLGAQKRVVVGEHPMNTHAL
jgi:hypothetical protein